MKRKKYEIAVYEGHMLNRLKAFTDCIMSIIATLMVLSFPMPHVQVTRPAEFEAFITPLIIYVVSFLVIMGFYFESIKMLGKIHKITGWQIFAYTIFLMVVSLFPVITRLDSILNSTLLVIFYVAYIFGLSYGHDWLIARTLAFNGEKNFQPKHFLLISLYASFVLSIVLSILHIYALSTLVLMWLPFRSLMKSVVVK